MVSVALHSERKGTHTHVRVFTSSRPGRQRGLAGTLVMGNEEYAEFRDALRRGLAGSEYPEILTVVEDGTLPALA